MKIGRQRFFDILWLQTMVLYTMMNRQFYTAKSPLRGGWKAIVITSVLTALAAPAATAHAELVSHKSKFSLYYLGVNVGDMKHRISVQNDRYEIAGQAKSNAAVSIVAKIKANFSSTGTIAENRLVPSTHSVKVKNGKKSRRLNMGFTSNGVGEVRAKPRIKYKSGTVPLEKSHLRNVLDPVSSLLFAVKGEDVGDGRKVCNRTMPIFDGRARINLDFSYKSRKSVKIKGFQGHVFTCSVRYRPVSGIRPHKKQIKFMQANRDMQVTMARMGDSNLYTLFGFRVRTSKGLASGSAYEFSSR
ncbi:MAG: DUF3108 domain-containing protein [Rhizobiaceae bacterium]